MVFTESHITKSNYYYRLQRVRKACLHHILEAGVPAFVELPALDTVATQNTASDISAGILPMICISNTKGLSAEIFPGASPEMLSILTERLATDRRAGQYVPESLSGRWGCSNRH